MKIGDHVCYRVSDSISTDWICARVEGFKERKGKVFVNLRTMPGEVAIQIPLDVLTVVKTVWRDTMKPVIGL
jgi:hypothetical protein